MNKKELAIAAIAKLREKGARKPVHISKQEFIISDSTGNIASFNIKPKDRQVIYTIEDAVAILDATIETIIDSLRNGEEISIKGFGTLKLHKRAARRTKQPGTNNWVEVEERLVPKFFYGNDLRMAARSYELISDDNKNSNKVLNDIFEDCYDAGDIDE